MTKKYIAYYRVSTNKQEYGITAQKNAVNKWIKGKGKIISSFQENISGKINDRIELLKAVNLCKETEATLLIAKLDRLSRDVAFLFQLKNSGIDIACCDLPELNTLTLGIFATMAQHERELISRRTKEGLAVARKKGRVGGSKKGCDNTKAIVASLEVRRIKALARNKNAASMAKTLRSKGMVYGDIANEMSKAGFTSVRGCGIVPQTVRRWLNY